MAATRRRKANGTVNKPVNPALTAIDASEFSTPDSPPMDWHQKDQFLIDVVDHIVALAWGSAALTLHHICFKTPEGEKREVASVEALIFDHIVLQKLFGAEWRNVGTALFCCDPMQRLHFFNQCLKDHGVGGI